ncbi:related to Staphylococcus multidrug resistance protein [Rhynchosporium secalis]|uniref:Related to Staphylococcus multidrug resistance protein n=1 Tax=Rhynchosporium secalis TaxID=38038 RepID=A0A1E1MMN9_RHYSE|nr:related to Staphylococcus multidrug resistance protein [Rhynchosporium secalis]
MAPRYLISGLEEVGLISLWTSTFDVKLLCSQRFVRLFAYGGSTLILVSYLQELDISKSKIGLFMTLTLVGDTAISCVLTLFADALGRKSILALGAGLMAVSGVAFATSGNYWILLIAAVIGVISPSGNEIGPFRAVEESTLAHLTPAASRGDIYAWYSLIGTAGTAFGLMTTGWILSYMIIGLQWGPVAAYRIVFWAYAAFGVLKLCLTLALSSAVELKNKEIMIQDPEAAPLLGDGAEDVEPEKSHWLWSKLPAFSSESKAVVINLCILFALDAFASGLAPLSWVTFFFHEKFHLKEGVLGSLFSTTAIIAALSMLLASSIAKRIGNIQTMVFTHLPSAIFLALIPIPDSVTIAMLFLILRSCTQSMDVAPRSAFLAAVVLPHERTAVMGMVNIAKSLGQSSGPFIAGVLAGKGMFWAAFVSAGVLKASYDLGMLAVFKGHKTHDERAEDTRVAEEEEVRDSANDEL